MPLPLSTTTEQISSADTTSIPESATANTSETSTTTKTEPEEEAERIYKERMEEEYAKREGGA
ncbi:hypothetical protein PVAG01_07097 [Phlyctema vagabunda]|uniref:Uncharacterized protein n=1 Tax=Phlyctema vagabunda TaxID=108571 RepID=A0ABR4PBW4_9HELO